MTARSYSLAEVAAVYLPPQWDGVLWLSRRLNRGQMRGYKVGRTWRMTDADVEANFENRDLCPTPERLAAPTTAPTPHVSVLDGLSSRSRRRVVRTS